MKNAEALTWIRNEIQKKIDEKGWGFILRPTGKSTKCYLVIKAEDAGKQVKAESEFCILIENGRDYKVEDEGDLDNLAERLKHALNKLHIYALTCGIIDERDNVSGEIELRRQIKKNSLESLKLFFDLLDQLFKDLSISNDSKLVFSTSSDQLSFHIGHRYCLVLKKNKFSIIAPIDYSIPELSKTFFSGDVSQSYYKNVPHAILLKHYPAFKQAVQIELNRENKTQVKEYDNAAFRKAVFDMAYRANFHIFPSLLRIEPESSNKEPMKINSHALNTILFGPPGTGKTYTTVLKALEILGEDTENKDRKQLKSIFDTKIAEGQIVFTTFHQSMSYEDFIEGIKPETIDGRVTYNIKPGIFKEICTSAQTPNQVDFTKAYDRLKKDLSEKEGELLELETPTGKTYAVSLNSNDNLSVHTGPKKEKQGVLTKENLQKQLNGEIKFIGWEGYFKGLINYLVENYQYNLQAEKFTQNYVLIIDEINRGNVSQIFGELITLIEEDKRLGQAEALEVTLPYSKEKFGVPANLYIIGTMNTADRSVEALDTALRRRFSFVEMPPKYDLDSLQKEIIEGYSLSSILLKINLRIEKLLGKDNLIGHSYFLEVKDIAGLRAVFQNKILPLLQEYFYGDYGKIGLVLGKGFVQKAPAADSNIFAKFGDYDTDGLAEKEVYHLVNPLDLKQMPEDVFKAALISLMR